MFGPRLRLFKVFGFEVWVDASWVIIAALITWSLAVGFFPFFYPGLSAATYWWMGAVGALGLFLSIIVHELSHSLVAGRYGLQMKGITLFVFGGVAEMEHEPPNAKAEFMMAIAGPIASILIGFIFYGAYLAGREAWPLQAVAIVAYLFWINWVLAAFNMVPAFPLDGGRVLRAAIWHFKGDLRRATRISASIGSGFGIVLIILGVFQLFTGNFVAAVWWALIGLFIRAASQASYQQVVMRTALEGQPVRRFMNPHPITVPPGISVEELVNDYVYRYHHKMYPVVSENNRLEGCVTIDRLREIPRGEWDRHSVREMSQTCSPENTITPETESASALMRMSRSGRSRLMVVEGDRVVGVLSLRDLLSFISTKLNLEGERTTDFSYIER